MSADKKFLAKSIQKKEELIVAYCAFTNMPFVVCDPETYNDQIWLFDTEAQLQEFAKPYTEKKILLRGVKYPNKAFLSFFSTLFTMGVNELAFVSENGTETIELTELVQQPDFSKIPQEKRPILNPELQLTGMYFMQEASRPIPMEEKEQLAELEEELAANLTKARYLVPIEFLEGEESDMEKLKNKKYRFPILKNKNGDVMQPLFTDPVELGKFNKENKFKALTLPFDNLSKLLVGESKGFLLNPLGAIERTDALEAAEPVLQAHSDIQAFVGINENSAMGIASAIQSAGLSEQGIIVTGVDSTEDVMTGIKDGYLAYGVAQNPYQMGYMSVQDAIKVYNGADVDSVIELDCEYMTQDNIDFYIEREAAYAE